MPGLLGVPVPANSTFGSTGSMARLHTIEPRIGVSSRRQWMPPSSLAYTPRSVPAYTTSGRRESCKSARTMQSECIPSRIPVRVQLSPSSALIMTPWPIVPTRMVPGFAMLHLLGVRTVPFSRARDYTPIGQGPRGSPRHSSTLGTVLGGERGASPHHGGEGVVEDRERAVDLGVAGYHGGHEAEHVHAPMASAHLEDEALLEAIAGDRRRFLVGRRLVDAIGHELDAQEHAAPAHVPDDLEPLRHLVEGGLHVAPDPRRLARYVLLHHHLETGQARCAENRVRRVRARSEVAAWHGT